MPPRALLNGAPQSQDELATRASKRTRLQQVLLRGRKRDVDTSNPIMSPVPVGHLPVHGSGVQWTRCVLRTEDRAEPDQAEIPLLIGTSRELSNKPRPSVVLLHGTGCCAENLVSRGAELVRLGFLVVLADSRYHGARRGETWNPRCQTRWEHDKDRYEDELCRAWTNGGKVRPFVYDTAADMMFVADYLLSRNDVTSLSICGISLGGMHAWFAGASDERWACVVPMIAIQNFGFAIETKCAGARVASIPRVFDLAAGSLNANIPSAESQSGSTASCPEVVSAVWRKICPGLLEEFDVDQSLPLLFPRNLFVANGRLDPRCPAEGLQVSFRNVRQEYSTAECPVGHLLLRFYECEHEVTSEMWNDVKVFLTKAQLRI